MFPVEEHTTVEVVDKKVEYIIPGVHTASELHDDFEARHFPTLPVSVVKGSELMEHTNYIWSARIQKVLQKSEILRRLKEKYKEL